MRDVSSRSFAAERIVVQLQRKASDRKNLLSRIQGYLCQRQKTQRRGRSQGISDGWLTMTSRFLTATVFDPRSTTGAASNGLRKRTPLPHALKACPSSSLESTVSERCCYPPAPQPPTSDLFVSLFDEPGALVSSSANIGGGACVGRVAPPPRCGLAAEMGGLPQRPGQGRCPTEVHFQGVRRLHRAGRKGLRGIPRWLARALLARRQPLRLGKVPARSGPASGCRRHGDRAVGTGQLHHRLVVGAAQVKKPGCSSFSAPWWSGPSPAGR